MNLYFIQCLLQASKHFATIRPLESTGRSYTVTFFGRYVYWGEYPLSFAACLGQEECYRLILARVRSKLFTVHLKVGLSESLQAYQNRSTLLSVLYV